ncbi:MAG: hypothetical protein EA374_02960 [Acholeplasmatales bacterium]|nr:MAG: hypothetical protein EA374_02960 [Acholeplasmatales bacterium]
MKKIVCVTLMLFMLAGSALPVEAGEYLTYQNITFRRAGAKLLEDYSQSEYDQYVKKVERRRFWGWRTYTVMQNEPVTFQKDTLYVISNEGFSPIQKSYYFNVKGQGKLQVSATGNIGLTGAGDLRGFRLGLDAHIRPQVSYETTSQREERVDIRMTVDPRTTLRVEVFGEGKVTNGVAKYYRFWRNTRQGGWEVFVLTTEYFSIVKAVMPDDADVPDNDVDADTD